ncbi:hypothetical protein FC695_24725 [Bacillus cereus]|uniref:Uncharacterized protein n=1 Tax=Bacillus cereus TaxID=1396 RepID=A0A9X9A5G3_BACCE|nr:hypothetical protein EEL55_16330 [Bacillus thuringiensis]TKI97888.1 hypothetical protein FC695_24725 [Bacillus cereus]
MFNYSNGRLTSVICILCSYKSDYSDSTIRCKVIR